MSENMASWWKTGTVYQIYPKSFQATSGRATGDLLGVIQRLDYLKQLGVSAIWLTPIYPSPQVDNGYDVANYCEINPEYGSMADFEELVTKAHERNIKIMMDMVFNHTSTQHPWFQSALDKTSPYRSFYIWKDASSQGQEPNNWRSKFGGKAWQWHQASNQYYLHLFATKQADLNWENPDVRRELKQVCQFWADKGVDALRLDVINLVSKHQLTPLARLGEMNYHTGYQFTADLIKQHKKTLSTIVCATDTIALGVNKYLQENSITDITVGSIGQSKLLHFLFPDTVSIHLGFHEAGILAAQTLLALLKKSSSPSLTIVPSTLVIDTLSNMV